jgi:hypothetical protein
MALTVEFISGRLKADGLALMRASRGQAEFSLPMVVEMIHGNTIDAEIWKTANWWFVFREGDFEIEVSEPQEDTGGRSGGSPAGITVRFPLQLLPGFLDRLGPNKNHSFSLELSSLGIVIS